MKAGLLRNLSNVDGIWYPNAGSSSVSYSSTGHQECFEVENRSFWFSTRNEVILSVLRRHKPLGTMLDVGGGNGMVSYFLQRHGVDIVLVEPGREGVQNARKRGVQNVVCARLQDLDTSEDLIPAVGLFDVVEHVEDDIGFLRSVADMMAGGGSLYITVPAYQLLWSDHDERAGHFRRYTLDSISRAVERAGFSVDFASYFFSPLPPFILLGRVVKERIFAYRTKSHREQKQAEHGNPAIGSLFRNLCKIDLAFISRGIPILFGSSCILVAHKANSGITRTAPVRSSALSSGG